MGKYATVHLKAADPKNMETSTTFIVCYIHKSSPAEIWLNWSNMTDVKPYKGEKNIQ